MCVSLFTIVASNRSKSLESYTSCILDLKLVEQWYIKVSFYRVWLGAYRSISIHCLSFLGQAHVYFFALAICYIRLRSTW